MIMPAQKSTSRRSTLPRNKSAYSEFVGMVGTYTTDHRKLAASVADFARRHGRSELEYVEKQVPAEFPGLSDVNLAYALGVLTGIMIKEYRRKL